MSGTLRSSVWVQLGDYADSDDEGLQPGQGGDFGQILVVTRKPAPIHSPSALPKLNYAHVGDTRAQGTAHHGTPWLGMV